MLSSFRTFGWAAVVCAGMLVACGGGGGGGGATTPPVAGPTITQGPLAISTPEGTTASFSVTATGAGLSYQWQRNGINIANATGATYTTPVLGLADSGAQFSVIVSTGGGSQSSQSATLIVFAVALSFDQQPPATIATLGANASFSARAIGAQSVKYQWYRAGIAIEGATSSTLQVNGVRYSDDNVPYFVTASFGDKSLTSQSARLTVMPPTTPKKISACQEITSPGSYVLDRDIGPGSTAVACLNIHDTQAVQLDCAGFSIAQSSVTYSQPLEVTQVMDLSVKNCKMTVFFLNLTSSSKIAFTANTIVGTDAASAAFLQISHTDHIVVDNNILTGAAQQNYGSYVTFSNNRITGTKQQLTANIVMNFGAHNRILGNTLDGAWDGQISTGLSGTREGFDDGIVVSDTNDMVIADNLIQNVWDCGIEWVGTLANSEIRDNRIVQAEYCGIGGWYFSSVLATKFVRNTVERASQFFASFRVYGLRPAGLYEGVPADTVAYFKDNVFDGNVFATPNGHFGTPLRALTLPLFDNYGYSNSISSIPGEVVIPPLGMQIANNVFRNNQFGKISSAPYFGETAPIAGYVIDGGGNVCSAPTPPSASYPLKCN